MVMVDSSEPIMTHDQEMHQDLSRIVGIALREMSPREISECALALNLVPDSNETIVRAAIRDRFTGFMLSRHIELNLIDYLGEQGVAPKSGNPSALEILRSIQYLEMQGKDKK